MLQYPAAGIPGVKLQRSMHIADVAALEALKMLHTRLKAPERSFQDRARLLGPVFQVAMTLVQVASVLQVLLLQLHMTTSSASCVLARVVNLT